MPQRGQEQSINTSLKATSSGKKGRLIHCLPRCRTEQGPAASWEGVSLLDPGEQGEVCAMVGNGQWVGLAPRWPLKVGPPPAPPNPTPPPHGGCLALGASELTSLWHLCWPGRSLLGGKRSPWLWVLKSASSLPSHFPSLAPALYLYKMEIIASSRRVGLRIKWDFVCYDSGRSLLCLVATGLRVPRSHGWAHQGHC